LGIRLLGTATLGLGAIWAAVGLIVALALAGQKVGMVIISTLFGLWIAGIVLLQFLIPDQYQHLFFLALVALTLASVAAGFVASWRLHLISRGTLLLAASIDVAMLAAGYSAGVPIEKNSLLLLLWGCCVIPFPLTAAPLAVWWNRHR
jgi:hypothetical protein